MRFIDKILYLYSTGFVIILIASSVLSSQRGPSTLLLGLIFAPVALYLIFTLIKYLRHLKDAPPPTKKVTTSLQKIMDDNEEKHANPPDYSDMGTISRFFYQTSPLFLVTIALFSLALTTSVMKAAIHIMPDTQEDIASQITYQP